MTIEIVTGLLISFLALVVAFQSYQLNKQNQQLNVKKNQSEQQKDDTEKAKNDAKESAKIQAHLEYIGKGVEEIRIDTKVNEKRVIELSESVIRIDESNKSAHKRIDKLEDIINEN